MRIKFTAISLCCVVLAAVGIAIPAMQACKEAKASASPKSTPATMHPKPMGEEEDEEMLARKKAYIELIHKAAPGTNWRLVEEQNKINSYFSLKGSAAKTTSSFAGGAFNATWHERGNDNIAGRVNSFAFLKSTSTLYAAADGGSIWKTTLPAISWVKVADAAEYNSSVLGLMPISATGGRLFLSSGTKIWRTDNDGATFDTSAGISFPVAWGGNYIYKVIPVDDAAHTVYAVTFGWDAGSWTARFSLYASTDSGVNFHYIRNFGYHNSDQLSFCSPAGSGKLYALGVINSAADTLYTANAGVVTVTSTTNTFNSGDNKVDMQCVISSGTTHFYALTGGSHVYHSTNFGTNWISKSTVTNAYIIGVSPQHPDVVTYGGVEAFRSTDSGASWTIVNTWGSYYAAVATKLHADLRNFSSFQYTSGSEFRMIGTDGGAWISNDNVATVSNISLNGLHDGQLWDHITHPTDTNIIIGGAQDQGLQQTASGGGSGLVSSIQVISGDYGQLRISGGGATLWPEYPGGNMYIYNNLSAPTYLCSWTMSGTQKPNVGWMLATSDYFTTGTQDEILIGGGEITGDSGSYLVKLSLNTSTATVTPSQYNYNFRTHTRTATAGIAAIGISKLSSSLIYVAAEDGTFFYSTDAGSSWNITPSFLGVTGSYLYGSTILASVDSVNKVYYGGSGYSNPGVYVSRDHGQTFTAMGTGLPPTLVNRLAGYKNDSFIFAATDAGPYIYSKATNSWYSLTVAGVPAVSWKSVEYIRSQGIVRFGTYGRGIWDLVIDKPISHVAVNNQVRPDLGVVVAPNPVKSGGAINLLSSMQQQVQLTIYATNGVQVFSDKVNTNNTVNMPQLAPGIYVCEMMADGKVQRTMISVN